MRWMRQLGYAWLMLLLLLFPFWLLTRHVDGTSLETFFVLSGLLFLGLVGYGAPLLLLDEEVAYRGREVPLAASRRTLVNVGLALLVGLVVMLGVEMYFYEHLLRVTAAQSGLAFVGGGFVGAGVGSLLTNVFYTSAGGRFVPGRQWTWVAPKNGRFVSLIRILTGLVFLVVSIYPVL